MAPSPKWYFDADTVGTGKVLSHVRDDVTWPGDDGQRPGPSTRWLPASPVPSTDVDDDVWIPAVARAGLTIVTRDHRIQSRLGERAAVVDSAARMFAIAQGGSLNRWELLEVVVTSWRAMEEIVAAQPGPFIYTVSRTGRPRPVLE